MATVIQDIQSHQTKGGDNPQSSRHTFPRPKSSSKLSKTSLKEGSLFKRQRGRKANDLKGLKFQQRYCVLSVHKLEYYSSKKDKESGHKPSGSLQVARIKIVEEVPEATFKRKYCFQAGDEQEVLYFVASSEKDRKEWTETFKIAAFTLNKNKPSRFYHTGAFGKQEKNVWSCCTKQNRKTEGCRSTVKRKGSLPPPAEVATGDSGKGLSKSLPSYGFDDHSDLVSCDSGWYDDAHEDSDSEDGGDKSESSTPTTITTPPITWSSKQSLLSEDSGKGNSTLDLAKLSPAPLRNSKFFGKTGRQSTQSVSSLTIAEESTSLSQTTPMRSGHTVTHPYTFTHKTSINISSEEEHCYSTTVLYRGTDSMICAANTGKVSLISGLNSTNPQHQSILTDGDVDSPSVAAWGKSFVIGSSKLYFGCLENVGKNKTAQDHSHKLVALGPDGSFFSASKGDSSVDMMPNAAENDCWSLKASDTILKVPGQIFSLTVSPHPNHPWIAVGFTSLKDRVTDFVSVFNYKTKCYKKHNIEIGQNSGLCLAFTHDGQHLYAGSDLRIQCFNMCATSNSVEFNYTFNEDASITSMCCSPVRHHLAVGLKTGTVKVFMGDPSQSTPAEYTITDKGSNGRVTSLSYSRDGMKTAIAFQNGLVQIWKASTPPKERPLARTGTLKVTSEGQTYHSQEDGYTITIPEGAVKPGTVICLHYGVAPDSPYGPYEFEDGAQPVSPIISLCPEPADAVFLKPIEVTLPHFIACRTPEDCQTLSFYKTQHNNFRVEIGVKTYQFEKINDCSIVHFSRYCTISTNQKVPQGAATLYTTHCCDLCIAKKYSEDDTSKAWLSLSQIVPKHPDFTHEYEVYYCLSYFLETCLQIVDEQYPDDRYDKKECRVVSFASEANMLQINTSAETLKGGWLLRTFQEQRQIMKEDVCFWNDSLRYRIKELVRTGMYPPKIRLRVQPGEMVREGVTTTVSFSGVKGCYGGTEINFTLELVKPFTIDCSNPVSSRKTSKSSTSTASYQSAASDSVTETLREVTDKVEGDCNEIALSVDCRRLAFALFSASTLSKCPYLDDSAIKLVKAFPKRAKSASPSEKFITNFEILTDVLSIAERFPKYILVIQSALRSAVDDPRLKDSLRPNVSLSASQSLSDDLTSVSNPMDGTEDVAEVNHHIMHMHSHSASSMNSTGHEFTHTGHSMTGGLLRQAQEPFSSQLGDPHI